MKKLSILLIVLLLTLPIVLARPTGDFNKDKCVDMVDFGYFVNHYGAQKGDELYKRMYDLNKDNIINSDDLTIFSDHYGEGCS